VRAAVKGVRHALRALAGADSALKAQVYSDLGVRLSYDHVERIATVEVPLPRPGVEQRVSETGLEPARGLSPH
jgi:hypothetical protein